MSLLSIVKNLHYHYNLLDQHDHLKNVWGWQIYGGGLAVNTQTAPDGLLKD